MTTWRGRRTYEINGGKCDSSSEVEGRIALCREASRRDDVWTGRHGQEFIYRLISHERHDRQSPCRRMLSGGAVFLSDGGSEQRPPRYHPPDLRLLKDTCRPSRTVHFPHHEHVTRNSRKGCLSRSKQLKLAPIQGSRPSTRFGQDLRGGIVRSVGNVPTSLNVPFLGSSTVNSLSPTMSLKEVIARSSGDSTPESSAGEAFSASPSELVESEPPLTDTALLTQRFLWGGLVPVSPPDTAAVALHVRREGAAVRASAARALRAMLCRVLRMVAV